MAASFPQSVYTLSTIRGEFRGESDSHWMKVFVKESYANDPGSKSLSTSFTQQIGFQGDWQEKKSTRPTYTR